MKAVPAFQFYGSDWLRDPGLRSCSLAARGLWIDMLAFMHEAEPYGHLRLNGKDIGPPALARMVGSALKETEHLLNELEDAGVFSRTEQGTIFSRRMVRDQILREKRGQYGHLSASNPSVPRKKETRKDTIKDTFRLSFRGSPSSSSSSSSSGNKEKIAGSASPAPANGTPKKRSVQLADEAFIADLRTNEAYTGIDIDREIGKCRAWLSTPKGRGKQLTRSRLVNWLNRIDTPLNGHNVALTCTKQIQSPGDRFLHPCGQPSSPQSRPAEPRCAEHCQKVSPSKELTHAAH